VWCRCGRHPAAVFCIISSFQRQSGMRDISKVVLAYSGGLDTSVILKWLQDTYNCEVVTFTADIGQGEELDDVRPKAEALGVREIFIDDLRTPSASALGRTSSSSSPWPI